MPYIDEKNDLDKSLNIKNEFVITSVSSLSCVLFWKRKEESYKHAVGDGDLLLWMV